MKMQHRILITPDKKDFVMYWGDTKKKNTVSSTIGITLPLNRRGRVEKFKQFIPIDDRNISITSRINIKVLNEFEIEKDFDGRIHITYDNEVQTIVKVWEQNPTIIEVAQIPKGKETFNTQNLKVFTIPLKVGVIVMAVDARWTFCHFPISDNKKGIIGETIPEISNGTYMTDCRSELIIREILPELEFFIHIKDKELIGAKLCAGFKPGYYVAVKDRQTDLISIVQTHHEIPDA